MNPWQLALQLKHELATVTWADGSASKVFGADSVFVYAGAQPAEDDHPPGFPFALVTMDTADADDEDPELLTQTFTIVSAVEVAGDPLGEFAVVGGSRADLGKSGGAGIAEVAERVRFALQRLTGFDGAAMVVSAGGTSAPNALGRGRHLAFDQLTVRALCTSQPFYAAPQQLRRVGDVLSWKGAWCAQRFDFLRFRLGYVTGTTPASSPGGLTAVIYSGTNFEFDTTVLPGRVYQVFADYDPRGTGSAAKSSAPLVGSYVLT